MDYNTQWSTIHNTTFAGGWARFSERVPGNLPPPPQPVLHAYLFLNANRYRRPWFVTRATLRGCCRFGLRLLRPCCLSGGCHFRLLGRLRGRLRRGIWVRGGLVVALTSRPIGLRDSTPQPGSSVQQRARLADRSERQGGLWRRSFGQTQALALQELPYEVQERPESWKYL